MMILNKLPKKFEQTFPKAAKAARLLDANIVWHGKAFWLDGDVQLTGYELSDGKRLSIEDNDDIAEKRLLAHGEGLKEIGNESLWTRFNRLMIEAPTLKLQWRHFSTYRHPSGDRVSVFFNGDQIAASLVRVDKCFYGKGKTVPECVLACTEDFAKYIGKRPLA